MESPATKRQKLSGPLIGTHNGHFHADEALAVYLLRLLPTYAESPLVRTRDAAVLDTCHTVVDVGGAYDPAQNRYDHHQREFATTFPKHSTKLSSAGLVYLHFGKAIIAQQTGLDINSDEVSILFEKLYDDFVEAFDANDNGISAYDAAELRKLGITKRFNDRGFSLASVVNRLNYRRAHLNATTEPVEPPVEKTKEQLQDEEDARFAVASEFTGGEFVAELTDKFQSWLPARQVVSVCFDQRRQYHASGAIMVLPHRKEGLPWSDHLYSLEEESNTPAAEQVLYALFPESGEPDSKWRIRAVSVSSDSFENRKGLPEPWRGVRDEALDTVSGIAGCVFVHASGFIGGNKTFEGALAMAQKAVETS